MEPMTHSVAGYAFRPRTRLFLAFALGLLTGCSSTQGLTPVDPSPQRMQLEGFSIVPPRGENWFSTTAALRDAVWRTVAGFVKRPPDGAPGAAIWATAAVANLVDTPFQGPDQLLDQLVRSREAELQGPRFRLLEFRPSAGPVPGCRRYDAVAEDRGVAEFPSVVFILTVHHTICLHPTVPTLAVNMAYSERRRQGQPETPLASEGEPYLRSLQFASLSRPTVVATIALQGDPEGIAADEQAVWVAEYSNNSVVRIDLKTNTVAKRYPVGMRPVGLAVGEGAVWVTSNWADEVWTIDLKTDEVRGSPIRVGRGPLDVAVGLGSVWVTNSGSGTVSRIDPRTRQVVATIPLGPEPIGVAVSNSVVWVTAFKDNRVWRIDPRTNRVIGQPISVNRGPTTVIASPLGVWITSQPANLSRIEEIRNAVASTTTVGQSASGIAAVGRQIWVTDHLAGVVWRVDAATQKVIEPSIPVGNRPLRLVVGGSSVWVSNAGSGTLSRIAGF
jgi:YVTN family beta-propeller protein